MVCEFISQLVLIVRETGVIGQATKTPKQTKFEQTK